MKNNFYTKTTLNFTKILIFFLGKYLDDAAHQQESDKDSMKMKSEKMRAKREVFPVPQTDSDAAKGISM